MVDKNSIIELNKLGKKFKYFDAIIDDGSHFPKHQKKSFDKRKTKQGYLVLS